ncbi:MAG: choice-of-anchor E domain-containing protein, partial [Gammaproteobacteria bacterium]
MSRSCHLHPVSRRLACGALTLALTLPATGHAMITSGGAGLLYVAIEAPLSTTTTSATVPAFSGGSFGSAAVTGLSQFNPALGTLERVTFSVDGSYDVDLSLFTNVVDETSAHSVDADVQFQVSLDVPAPGGGGLLFASGVDGANFFCSGGAFSSPCTDDLSPQTVSDSYFASEDATQRLADDGLLSLFVGTGNLDFLTLSFFQFASSVYFATAENIDTDTYDTDASFNVGPT